MPIWPFTSNRPPQPSGQAAEIARLEAFVESKAAERDGLIRQVKELEAKISILHAGILREPSPAVREIKEAELNDLLDQLDGLRARAERVSLAIRVPQQTIKKLKDLAVDRTAAVSAEQIDVAISEFEHIVANRQEAAQALSEYDRIENAALAVARQTLTRPSLSIPAPTITETPESRREEQRVRLREAGLLQDE
jgi:predicted DNA-binding protein